MTQEVRAPGLERLTEAPAKIWATINGASTRLPDGGRQLIGGWSEDADRPRAVEYVRADLALLSSPSVPEQGIASPVVKALEWTQKAPPAYDHEPFVYWAAGVGGHYRAEPDGLLWMAHDAFVWEQHANQKAAKAAAQLDHEKHVAALLSVQEPAPSPAVVVDEAMVERLLTHFRKKPVVIEAHRIGIDPWPRAAWEAVTRHEITLHHCSDSDGYILIKTLEGEMRGDHGDWLIRGVKGEFYPCKPDIFEATYEPAALQNAGGEQPAPKAAVSVQDPAMILAGIRQFGLAADGSDLRDLEAAIARSTAAPQEAQAVSEAMVHATEINNAFRSHDIHELIETRDELLRAVFLHWRELFAALSASTGDEEES